MSILPFLKTVCKHAGKKIHNYQNGSRRGKIRGMDDGKEVKWPFFALRFNKLLQEKGISAYRISEDTSLRSPQISTIRNGTRRATDEILRILADYKPLETTFGTLQAWRAIDENPEETIKLAFEILEGKNKDS